jgi:hypothetical protein
MSPRRTSSRLNWWLTARSAAAPTVSASSCFSSCVRGRAGRARAVGDAASFCRAFALTLLGPVPAAPAGAPCDLIAAWKPAGRSVQTSDASDVGSQIQDPRERARSFGTDTVWLVRRRFSVRGSVSGRHSRLQPAFERRDLFRGPGAVAGHRAVVKAFEDRLCVRFDVLVRPEVEGELHRLLVAAAEERPDVFVEAARPSQAAAAPAEVATSAARPVTPSSASNPPPRLTARTSRAREASSRTTAPPMPPLEPSTTCKPLTRTPGATHGVPAPAERPKTRPAQPPRASSARPAIRAAWNRRRLRPRRRQMEHLWSLAGATSGN